MPLYDYKCNECHVVTESIQKSTVEAIKCPACSEDDKAVIHRYGIGLAYRMLSAPASFKFPDMSVLTKKRQRIKEPIWRYPDGSYEPVNP